MNKYNISPQEIKIQIALGTLPTQMIYDHHNFFLTVTNLKDLSKIERWEVRRAVAFHPKATHEILKVLSKDDNWQVRYGVACNRVTPIEILQDLSFDSHPSVRDEARGMLHIFGFNSGGFC